MSNESARPTPPYLNDLKLAAAIKRRERNAGEEFVRRFGAAALATARRFLQSEPDCDDAVQESFLSAIQSIGSFKGASDLGTWLHRIVVNVCLMKLRSRARQSRLSIEVRVATFDASGRPRRAARWKPGPDERLICEETRELVRRCIDMLRDDQRTVLILRDIEEINTKETAEILCETPAAVKTRLHRAHQRSARSWNRTSPELGPTRREPYARAKSLRRGLLSRSELGCIPHREGTIPAQRRRPRGDRTRRKKKP